MVKYLLKKSYQLKDLKQIEFQDLWGDHGIFTTMWIFGKPAKILFFNSHLKNLISSLKKYQIKKKYLKADILKLMEPFKSNSIRITMRCSKTKIPMGLEDNINKIYGFQFHPESFLTENGDVLIKKILSA